MVSNKKVHNNFRVETGLGHIAHPGHILTRIITLPDAAFTVLLKYFNPLVHALKVQSDGQLFSYCLARLSVYAGITVWDSINAT